MRIIYYSPHPTHDIVSEVGYATHQREVINALKALGHDVLPIIMGGTELSNLNPLATDSYSPSKIKVVLKKIVPRFLWTSFNNFKLRLHDKNAGKRLEENIIGFKPDLIYERSEYLQDSGALMASKYKIKYFLEVNAPFVEEMRSFEGYSLYEGKAHGIEKFKLKKADKVIAVSTALADFLVERYGCGKEKIFVQPNCINPSKIHFDSNQKEHIVRNLGIEGKKVIGFVGSMFPYHGVDMLIRAFSDVCKKRSDVCLLIVGDGIILNDMKALTDQLGIRNDVVFTGKIPHSQVFDYIAAMDICIMAKSNWYGSPVKIFEYGLMSKPIIAPDTAPVRDVMIDGVDAVVIDENEASLATSILRILEDRSFSNNIASTFHDKVLDRYTWDHAAKNIIELCG